MLSVANGQTDRRANRQGQILMPPDYHGGIKIGKKREENMLNVFRLSVEWVINVLVEWNHRGSRGFGFGSGKTARYTQRRMLPSKLKVGFLFLHSTYSVIVFYNCIYFHEKIFSNMEGIIQNFFSKIQWAMLPLKLTAAQ